MPNETFIDLLLPYNENLDEHFLSMEKTHGRLRIGMDLSLLLPDTELIISIIKPSMATSATEIISEGFLCYKHKNKIIINEYSYTGNPRCIDVTYCAYDKTIKSNIKHKVSKKVVDNMKFKNKGLVYILLNDIQVFNIEKFDYTKYIYSHFDSQLKYIVPYLKAFSSNFDNDLKKVIDYYS